MATAKTTTILKPVAPTTLYKAYDPGDQVNIVRGPFKGTSATVKSRDLESGRVTLVAANGIEVELAQYYLNYPKQGKEANPEITPDLFKQGRDEVAVQQKKVEEDRAAKVKPCVCGCGLMAKKGRQFVSGHDQTHKGNLIRAMQEGSTEAETELRNRNWRTESEIIALKGKKGKSKINPEVEAGLRETLGLT